MQQLNEKSIRFAALQQLREIQANMVSVSFLPVIGIMKENNPYIKNIIEFQDKLDSLTMEVQKFISDAKNGVDYKEPDEEADEEADEPEEEKEKKESEVEDSSEQKE